MPVAVTVAPAATIAYELTAVPVVELWNQELADWLFCSYADPERSSWYCRHCQRRPNRGLRHGDGSVEAWTCERRLPGQHEQQNGQG